MGCGRDERAGSRRGEDDVEGPRHFFGGAVCEVGGSCCVPHHQHAHRARGGYLPLAEANLVCREFTGSARVEDCKMMFPFPGLFEDGGGERVPQLGPRRSPGHF